MPSPLKSYKDYLDELPTIKRIVRERARQLIEHKIWNTIDYDILDRWQNNFEGDEEELLSTLLLDQLIIRSVEQTSALISHAIETALPNALATNVWQALEETDYLETLTSRAEKKTKIRIIPVIRDNDPPTKSGPSVARLYRRCININENFMIWPWKLKKHYENGIRKFIFIDDVAGSGDQFCNFVSTMIKDDYPLAEFIYIPLLAHSIGLKRIKNKYPKIKIGAIEVADESSSFFNRKATKNITDLKDLYLRVAKKHLSNNLYTKMALGYENLSTTISFSHATPNTTLPLYWYESDTFSPLVRR